MIKMEGVKSACVKSACVGRDFTCEEEMTMMMRGF